MNVKNIFFLIGLSLWALISNSQTDHFMIYPAPAGEPLSQDYTVSVEGHDVPVYIAKVAPEDAERRWKAMDDKKNSADFFDIGAFAYFDMNGKVTVKVTVNKPVVSVKILPTSVGITSEIQGNSVSFTLDSPEKLTIEINGEWIRSLHLFANPFEKNIPKPNDPDVIYFGPGIHEVSNMVVGDNKIIYIAGGAIVRGIIRPEEKFEISSYSGLRTYTPTFELRGKNISVRGRGIIDGSNCTTHSRNMMLVQGSDITLEGIIFRDASTWTIPVQQSDRVTITNVKLLGYRANSDGIDISNSRDVLVDDCFIRTLDDLIVVKSFRNKGETKRIVAKSCVLWNQVAHALSVGAEIQSDVSDILFTDCDIIHDQGREWSLRIFHCDSAWIRNVRFENIRIEESIDFISVWINEDDSWSSDKERGHIQGIVFKDITVKGTPLKIELEGFDEKHKIEGIQFQNVVINGKAMTMGNLKKNEFVTGVSINL